MITTSQQLVKHVLQTWSI